MCIQSGLCNGGSRETNAVCLMLVGTLVAAIYTKLACKCLPGFKPKSPENWNSGDFSGGCIRNSDECGKNDTFLSLKMMRLGNQAYHLWLSLKINAERSVSFSANAKLIPLLRGDSIREGTDHLATAFT